MDSGIASMTATFIPYLKTRFASRLVTFCFIKDVQRSHLGLPTVLWEVICYDISWCSLLPPCLTILYRMYYGLVSVNPASFTEFLHLKGKLLNTFQHHIDMLYSHHFASRDRYVLDLQASSKSGTFHLDFVKHEH